MPQDYQEAAKWYKLAAEQGVAWAQRRLGYMFDEGRVVTQDYQQAFKWFKLAAEQGDAMAQCKLAFIYAYGDGVPIDYVLSYKFANLSAAQGNSAAQEHRDWLLKKMTNEQIAEGQRLSSEAFLKKPK